MSVRYFENRQSGYRHPYQIEFQWEASKNFFTMWALEHPPDPYGKGVSHHHLYPSGKLCQAEGKESRTLEHAEAWAHWWMKRWSMYVTSGTFPMTSESVSVPD